MSATCVRCTRPMPDQAYACQHCGVDRPTAQLQTIADMCPAARDIAHGLARRASGGASGKPGSRLPLDLGATARLDAVETRLTRWARQIAAERGIAPPWVTTYGDPITAVSGWLSGHTEWIRHHGPTTNPRWLEAIYGPAPHPDTTPNIAAEFIDAVDDCARVVAGIARGPVAQRYLGPCGAETEWAPGTMVVTAICDGDVYARDGGRTGTCRSCGAAVDTAERRAWLDGEVRGWAFRASEIEDAYGLKANLIRQWATPARGLVQVHGVDGQGRQLYLLGQVLAVAADQAAKRAEAQARRARRAAARAAPDERMSA